MTDVPIINTTDSRVLTDIVKSWWLATILPLLSLIIARSIWWPFFQIAHCESLKHLHIAISVCKILGGTTPSLVPGPCRELTNRHVRKPSINLLSEYLVVKHTIFPIREPCLRLQIIDYFSGLTSCRSRLSRLLLDRVCPPSCRASQRRQPFICGGVSICLSVFCWSFLLVSS